MRTGDQLVFSGLHLPRPLDTGQVVQFLTQLAVDRTARRVVFEVRSTRKGVRHLVGTRASDLPILRRTLADLIPGSLLAPVPPTAAALPDQRPAGRPDVNIAARLHVQPPGLSLRIDNIEATTRALLSVLATKLEDGEQLALQVVIGPRRAPRLLSPQTPDPSASLLRNLLVGQRPASSEVRARLKPRAEQVGFGLTMRIGASSPDSGRRRRFMLSLLSALSTAQAPGVRIDLVREPADRLNHVSLPWRWPLNLSASELAGLLAWPIGTGELPGLAPEHPKVLRADRSVHSGSRVFASSAAPGDERKLGISAQDQTFHGITYGPSGSGKTTALLHLILADIEAGRSVAVLDPKRQLVDDILARIPEHRRNDVVELNASDETPVGFNPLDVTGRDPDVVVDGIMAVFEAVFRDGWGPRTSDIFSACLRTLARATTTQQATLLDLPRLLTDPAFRRQQVGRVAADPALAGFWAWYDGLSAQAQAAVIAAPLNKLRQLLLRPALIRMLSGPTTAFRLRDLFRQNKIVLVPLNEGLLGPGTASLLGSLVIADLWQATQERAADPHASKRPAMVYIDEAPRFLNLPVSLADALAVSRSLGVGWFLAAQFRGQFPPPLRAAVDMNARSKVVFATEYEDARDTAKLTRDLLPDDFLSLPRFHAYANLVANGHPSGWALIRTLPPPAPSVDPETVRAISRANYAVPAIDEPSPEASDPTDAAAPLSSAPAFVASQVGRKRRTVR